MFKVALTGGIAAGKTAVSDYFQNLGVPVIDTDIISRQIVEPGQSAFKAIVEQFGSEMLSQDGRLNRKALREIVFNQPQKRRQLENITHPAINQAVMTLLKSLQANYVILVIPLLVESGNKYQQDRVLLVDIPESLQIQRVMQRDQISVQQANKILQVQSTRQQRLDIADDVILNSGDMIDLQKQIAELHRKYLALAAAH